MVRSGAGLGPGLLYCSQGDRADSPLARACKGRGPWGAGCSPQHSALGPPNITNYRGARGDTSSATEDESHSHRTAFPHGKAPLGRPVWEAINYWVLSWLPWAGHSTWTPCAAWPTVGARRQDRPMHRGRRGYMSAQGVSPGRCTVSCASKRDGSGQHVAPASSDKQISSRGRHPPRRHAMA